MVFLTPFMFERPSAPNDTLPFGLTNGQQRNTGTVVSNAVWYRGPGDRLGYGDIAGQDCRNIADKLARGQAFLIFRPGVAVKPGQRTPKEITALVDPAHLYEVMPWEVLSGRASFVIAPSEMYIVDDHGRSRFVIGEFSFKPLTRKGLRGLIS